MKRLFLTMLMLATVSVVSAQSEKYNKAMADNLKDFSEAKTSQDLLSSSAAFERIAKAEKSQWEPYYYAAFAALRSGMSDRQADKDALALKIDELITSGEALRKNADFYALRYMNATMQMLVNPMERWKTKGEEAEAAYQAGIQLDPNNASLYYLKSMNILHTPEQFGGGKAKAKQLFEIAVKASRQYVPENALSPVWGGEEARQELDKMK